MSVLACQRPDCDNIMCDRIVLGHYLCHDCYAELCDYRKTWTSGVLPGDVEGIVRAFLEMRPNDLAEEPSSNQIRIDAEFDRIVAGTAGGSRGDTDPPLED